MHDLLYADIRNTTLYYCQGLIKFKAETIYQIRPKLPRTETTGRNDLGRNDSGPKWLRAETNDPRMQMRL